MKGARVCVCVCVWWWWWWWWWVGGGGVQCCGRIVQKGVTSCQRRKCEL
jgi:hypothetical protein